MYFIRHANVVRDTAVSSDQWELSENGRLRARQLARQINEPPVRLFASRELKAIQTAQEMAAVWGVPWSMLDGIHEHERGSNQYIDDPQAFQTAVSQFLKHPDQRTFGSETAIEAANRLQTAVFQLRALYPQETVAVVTHGRILTAYLSQQDPTMDATAFWQALPLPALIAVDQNGRISQQHTLP